jgi:hypothetical protein
MKDEDIDKRHAAAYRVAGQAVMAFYLGGSVNDEGLEIDERRYCGLSLPFEHDAQAKERFRLLCDLAGWRAEHLWQGKGSSRDGYALTRSFSPSLRTVGKAGTIMMATMRTPSTLCSRCRQALPTTSWHNAIPTIRQSAMRSCASPLCGTPSSAFAAKLMERGKLSAAEALEETLRNYTNRASVFSSQVIDFGRSPDRCILMEASDSGLDDGITLVQRA